MRLKFPNEFGQILGINPLWSEKSIGNENVDFTYSVDLNAPYDRLYVYSDVAAFTNVGDTQAPILRILPFVPNQTNKFPHGISLFVLRASGKVFH